MSQIDKMLADATDLITVRRVYGEPYQSNGVTVIPAASVRGGFGGGEGEGPEGEQSGSGGGMGVSARPIGVYQIKGDQVVWVPAIDLSRIIVMGEVATIVALLVVRSIMRRRKR